MAKFVDPTVHAQHAASKEMKDFTRRFILFPPKWAAYPNSVKGLVWKKVQFNDGIKLALPKSSCGVYSFVLEPAVAGHNAIGYLLYVGKADRQSLHARCTNYLRERDDPKGRVLIQEMLRSWPEHLWLYYAEVADTKKIGTLEEELIEAFIPPFNDSFPATIRRQVKVVYRC